VIEEADRFAVRAWTVCGALGSALVGVFWAPDIQDWLRPFGVDPNSGRSALVIIAVIAVLGAFVTWRAVRR
jgi:hypothetical protein